MKTLLLLTALAATATAGPTFLGRDNKDQDIPVGVLKTIKRERKSPIPESPAELLSDIPVNSESLPSNNERASSAGNLNSGFKKPIIVKKKFGYHIYRDSDEELAQAEPRNNCRRQFRFKVCDEDNDQVLTPLRSTQTEDNDESDVEQSLKLAKEAVEILQRDLLKIERSAMLTQRKANGDKMHSDTKEIRKQDEILSENNGEGNQWKTDALRRDGDVTKPDEARIAEWKEAIEKIQKNGGILKNNEDTLKIAEPNIVPSEKETNLLKSRKTESIDANIAKLETDLLSKIKNKEVKQESPKSAEEKMETYATENKDVRVGLLSDSLKMEKAASLETSDTLPNIENDKNILRITKNEDQRNDAVMQGKSSEKFLDSFHEVKLENINRGDSSRNLKSEVKLTENIETNQPTNLRSTSQENIEEKRLKSNIEKLHLLPEEKSTDKDIENIQVKAASEEEKKEIKDINLKESKMEVKDAETSESRNSEILFNENESQTITENKEKSAISWIPELVENTENIIDLKAKNVDSRNELLVDDKFIPRATNDITETKNLNTPITTTFLEDSQSHDDQNNEREAEKGDEHLWSLESKSDKVQEHVDSLKLREAKEGDNKAIFSDIAQRQNIATTSLDGSHLSTDDSKLRNTLNEEEKQWMEPPLNNINDHLDSSKLREAEDTDEKLTANNVVQARNFENGESERLFENKKHSEEKSAALTSKATVDDAVNKEINREKVLFQKSSETMNEEKQKVTDDLRVLKNLGHNMEPNKHHNKKQDMVKERTTVDEPKMSFFRESSEVRDHLRHNVGSQEINDKAIIPSMKMSEMDYYGDKGNQHTTQLVQDKNIDIHESSHLKDTLSDWNREKYYHNIRDPYNVRWPHDRMRMDSHIDSNAGHVHMHHHPEHMHLEEDPHRFFPMERFVHNFQMENQHEPLNSPGMKENMHENGMRAPEWDIAMEPSMNMDMRHALDKNGVPWGFHRHAGFGSSLPLGGPTSGPGAVGLFPNANGGCGIPLLLSCSPSVVSGSLAKSHSLRYNDPAFRAGDDLRFYTKRDTKTHEDKLVKNANNFFITSA